MTNFQAGNGRAVMFKNGAGLALAALLVLGTPPLAHGQDLSVQGGSTSAVSPTIETIPLMNASTQAEQNEILTAIRNMVNPNVKVFLVSSRDAIMISGTADQVALTHRLIRDLDITKKEYRLTYTLTEMQDGKRVGVQHFSMELVDGQRSVMKQGSRIPISTAQPTAALTSPAEIAYIDVGVNIDATLSSIAGGAILKTKVEQSSVADEKSNVGLSNPVIRQVTLEGVSKLATGQPITIGSVDIPSSTRHVEIAVLLDPAR